MSKIIYRRYYTFSISMRVYLNIFINANATLRAIVRAIAIRAFSVYFDYVMGFMKIIFFRIGLPKMIITGKWDDPSAACTDEMMVVIAVTDRIPGKALIVNHGFQYP
jgi:hypothetical protein